MSTLKAIAVGCDADILQQLRRQLTGRGVPVQAEMADVRSVIASVRPAQAGDVLFLQQIRSFQELDLLRRLADTFGGRPIVALVDRGEDLGLILAANRAGAAQVVPLPLMGDDFGDALDRIQAFFAAKGGSTVIAVSGVTGGCGATTLAINLGYEVAHRREVRCVAAELSHRMGKLATYLNVTPEFTAQDIFSNLDRADAYLVKRVLTRIDDHFEILAGPYQAARPLAAAPGDLPRVLQLLRQLTDVVVLDLPCSFDDRYFEAVAAVDRVVLIGEAKIPSLHSLTLVREALANEAGHGEPIVVINRHQPNRDGLTAQKLCELLRVPRVSAIANDYAAVGAATNNGRPLRRQAPQSRALVDIDALADLLFPDPSRAIRGRRRPLLAPLTRMFGL